LRSAPEQVQERAVIGLEDQVALHIDVVVDHSCVVGMLRDEFWRGEVRYVPDERLSRPG
jgi:hypothetical protein